MMCDEVIVKYVSDCAQIPTALISLHIGVSVFMAESKCALCWNHGPPYVWEKAHAPHIPNTKYELILQLKDFHDKKYLDTLHRDELRHLFRETIRGSRHPGDVTNRMSSMNKDELQQRLFQHGISVCEKVTKGHLQTLLREHWQEQCQLAQPTERQPRSSEGNDYCEVVENLSQRQDSETAMEHFHVVKEQMEVALKGVWKQFGRNPKNKALIDHSAWAFESFLEQMKKIENSLILQD